MQPLTGNKLGIVTLAYAMKSQIDKLEADITSMERGKKGFEQKLIIQSRLSSVTLPHKRIEAENQSSWFENEVDEVAVTAAMVNKHSES
jgi:hypothetical protein